MAFIFIGCDKDDEKVLPEEQEPEQKQDDEEEMQHNGAYVLKFQVLTSENKDYFSITDVPEGYYWTPADSFYVQCLDKKSVVYHDMNSFAKIDGNTIISGDARYVFPDENGWMRPTRITGEWLNTVNYMKNQDRDKDTTNVWTGLSYYEYEGGSHFVLGMLNPDSLIGKAITVEIKNSNGNQWGYVGGFIFERFTYKPHSNNLDSVYISDFPYGFKVNTHQIHGHQVNDMLTIRLNLYKPYVDPEWWD